MRRLLELISLGLVATFNLQGCEACSEAAPSWAENTRDASLRMDHAEHEQLLRGARTALRLKHKPLLASSAAAAGPEPKLGAHELTWSYPTSLAGPMQVVISVPARQAESQRFPVLIAFHGRGEALKGPERGARGWIDDYGINEASARLMNPPLSAADLQNFYDESRLRMLNRRLAQNPYAGLIVVCPYTPDILRGKKPFSLAEPLARFVAEQLLPRIYRQTPALGTPESTGIDGVSLGGRAALLVGLSRPETFGAVAALQAAFEEAEIAELVQRAEAARKRNPHFRLRLLTSDGDYFLAATRALSHALRAANIGHEFELVPGPHDYAFNRGPGAYEMLLFHHAVLRTRAAAARNDY